ncbi:MAG TPA: hypothetical protein VHO72_17755 [Bacteroidales bacterium]|nr:hypothetical protein [Bacteroidales bacterium]
MFDANTTWHIQYNPWKHHMNWLTWQIRRAREDTFLRDAAISIISGFNNNYIDIYTGIYSPEQIILRIENLIKQEIQQTAFVKPLFDTTPYKLITLEDESVWVLQQGNHEEPWIHIHPAKFTPHSVRIYGTLLKTAILLMLLDHNKQPELAEINRVRTTYLRLSPLKNSYSIERIKETVTLLEMNMPCDNENAINS